MNETMVQHRLSRNGPVSVEVSNADCGVELTRVWSELDRYITTVVENDRERVVERANDLAGDTVQERLGRPNVECSSSEDKGGKGRWNDCLSI